MARGVDEVDCHVLVPETDAGGFDGNATAALHRQRVRVGGAGVHAALDADSAGVGQELLGQCGLAGIDMGEDTDIS